MEIKLDSIASTRDSQRSNDAKSKIDESEFPYFDNIPSHIIADILLQLPIKSLLTCKCVSKSWKTLISEPYFDKLYSDRARISFIIRTYNHNFMPKNFYHLECESEKFEIGRNNPVKLNPLFKLRLCFDKECLKKDNYWNRKRPFIGCKARHDKCGILNSCNGLLCLCHHNNLTPLVILNPTTGDFIRLPEVTKTPKRLNPTLVRIVGNAGFGFHPKTGEYKVIHMWLKYVKGNRVMPNGVSRPYGWVFEAMTLEIHTLGTSSWRNVEVDPQFSIKELKHATCVNGALHWIRFDNWQMSILCFNFDSEMLQLFPSPPCFENNNNNNEMSYEIIRMGQLSGFLYICCASDQNATMWIMKKYGIGESWTNVYNIDISSNRLFPSPFTLCCPLKHFEEGAIILLYLYKSHCFIYYELEKNRFKVFQIHENPPFFEVIPHIPSLISLKDVVKGDNIEVLNIHSR